MFSKWNATYSKILENFKIKHAHSQLKCMRKIISDSDSSLVEIAAISDIYLVSLPKIVYPTISYYEFLVLLNFICSILHSFAYLLAFAEFSLKFFSYPQKYSIPCV